MIWPRPSHSTSRVCHIVTKAGMSLVLGVRVILRDTLSKRITEQLIARMPLLPISTHANRSIDT